MKIEGAVLTFKLDSVKQALASMGVHGVKPRSEDFLPRITLVITAPDNLASRVADVLAAASRP